MLGEDEVSSKLCGAYTGSTHAGRLLRRWAWGASDDFTRGFLTHDSRCHASRHLWGTRYRRTDQLPTNYRLPPHPTPPSTLIHTNTFLSPASQGNESVQSRFVRTLACLLRTYVRSTWRFPDDVGSEVACWLCLGGRSSGLRREGEADHCTNIHSLTPTQVPKYPKQISRNHGRNPRPVHVHSSVCGEISSSHPAERSPRCWLARCMARSRCS